MVELFLVEARSALDPTAVRYLEVEMSPHGHYLVLELCGVRRVVRHVEPLEYRAEVRRGRWRGTLRLAADAVPRAPLLANAYRIHGSGEPRHYDAAHALPGERPDFHQVDRFPLLDS